MPKYDTIYRIVDRDTDEVVSAFSRTYDEQTDFSSPVAARTCMTDGQFEDREKYKVNKYLVVMVHEACDD